MSTHFEKLLVKEVRRETEDCVSVLLEVPQNLHEKFAYQPGQHITLRTFINNQEVRRSYSLCSSPLHKEWRIAVKKVDGGIFSQFANNDLKPGDTIELMPPMGHFILPDTGEAKHYVCFAAGSGITPVLSIIKTGLVQQPNSSFTLIYGNRTRQSIIFKEEIEALKNKFMSRFQLIHILSREHTEAPLNEGRIDVSKCDRIFNSVASINADAFFICGPEAMIFSIKDWLLSKGVDERKIYFELFNTTPLNATKKNQPEKSEEENIAHVGIQLDGISFSFDLPYNGMSILDAALQQGADAPYSCKGGVCTTCKAKLVKGEVEMEVNFGLVPEEVEQGFILTCQSHPRSKEVIIDFDVK
jgi:ring-1,2-phenylacetyl-CoA epoxidase subunit PaaE